MFLGTHRPRPDLRRVRRVKSVLREALRLSPDTTITVTELACFEDGCAPLETVIGLLRPDAPQLQHRLHKPIDQLDTADLAQACAAWGFNVPASMFAPLLQEG